MSSTTIDAEVGIVGAGVAGLAAAKCLSKHGRSFVVLEASHRIGGRAHTEWLHPNVPFDLGAHWIHTPSINPFTSIAKKLGTRLIEESDFFVEGSYFEHGAWLPEESAEALSNYYERQFEAILQSAIDDDRAVIDVIDNDSRWAPYFYLFFGQDYTCDVDNVSTKDVASYFRQGNDLAVVDGFGVMVTEYGADVPVSLNSAVEHIDWCGDVVKLHTNNATFVVEKVIITVSTGVLGNHQIEFSPPLPSSKRHAIAALPMGSCVRAALEFDPSVHASLPEDFTVMMGDEDPLHFSNRRSAHPYFEITTGGRRAEWMEKSGENATIKYIVEQLQYVTGADIAQRLGKSIVTAWNGDLWTRGAYSCALPGEASQRRELARPIDNKLYFAGEAVSQDHCATVHGASLSGTECALRI